jgi:hypothetical protein
VRIVSEEDFAAKIDTQAPWWAKAPIWLAAGIVGVPSMLAIGAGYFIAKTVVHNQTLLEQYNLSELQAISTLQTDATRRWEAISRLIQLDLETTRRTCLHEAKNAQERDECVTSTLGEMRKLPDHHQEK